MAGGWPVRGAPSSGGWRLYVGGVEAFVWRIGRPVSEGWPSGFLMRLWVYRDLLLVGCPQRVVLLLLERASW